MSAKFPREIGCRVADFIDIIDRYLIQLRIRERWSKDLLKSYGFFEGTFDRNSLHQYLKGLVTFVVFILACTFFSFPFYKILIFC